MNHVDERTLGLYAIDAKSVRNRSEIEAHLAACAECGAELQAIRAFEDALREPESWAGLFGVPAAPEPLRTFANRAETEDAEAVELLAEFEHPEAAARFVWAGIPRKPEYQTGGVARLLCKWANGMCERDPLYALKLAEAATLISTDLPDSSYPRKTIHELRGDAWKEQANAFRFLGRLHEALRAIAEAEAEYRQLPHEGIGLVAVKYIRGVIQYDQDDLDAAEQSAHEAAQEALHFGAAARYMNARYLSGQILLDRHEYDTARQIFQSILEYGEEQGDRLWIARASQAVGACDIERGNHADASRYLHEALRLFADLDFGPEVTRTHWTIARLLFVEGHVNESIYRFRRTIAEFTDFEMLTDAAVVAVDLAEILHAAGRFREIPKVLASVVRTFMAAGKLTSAMTALGYLKDAAAAGTMTIQLVAYVRRFVLRAERHPDLLFAPPPSPPL